MPRYCCLGSSSSGNCHYFSTALGGILVDAGLSCTAITKGLRSSGLPFDVRAVLVTHEHIDHVKGLERFVRTTGAALYCSAPTLTSLRSKNMIPPGAETHTVRANEPFELLGVKISPFELSHDCASGLGYRLDYPDTSAAILTDTGFVTEGAKRIVRGVRHAVVEANYDPEMLRLGPYPPSLQRRIKSKLGHLSNPDCAELCAWLYETGTAHFRLAHLSLNNNEPALALAAVSAALGELGAVDGRDYTLAALPDRPAGSYELF
ncbi:MAG: MBL fold metallo-hydrolase [Clostridia bacterium]|nr:MBL fold metallo-hydrolase [Clostridia bacterium]